MLPYPHHNKREVIVRRHFTAPLTYPVHNLLAQSMHRQVRRGIDDQPKTRLAELLVLSVAGLGHAIGVGYQQVAALHLNRLLFVNAIVKRSDDRTTFREQCELRQPRFTSTLIAKLFQSDMCTRARKSHALSLHTPARANQ